VKRRELMVIERLLLATGALVVLAFTSTGSTAFLAQDESEDSDEVCCLENQAYEGTCTVEPEGDETCESILRYLNSPMTEGKDYCEGTNARGGWVQVECQDDSEDEESQ
jgi:hypothetical protein